jgi:hypothetical protein
MATVTLGVTTSGKGGVTETWMVIDKAPVAFEADGSGDGACDVDDRRAGHTYVIWVDGPPGASVDYEITLAGVSKVKDTVTVDPGCNEQVAHNGFSL